MQFCRFFGFLAILLSAYPAWAAPVPGSPPPPPPSSSAPPSRDIVVTGTSERAVDTFVRQVISTDGDQQLSRWNKPICVRVLNLDKGTADFIADRITAVGRIVGAPVAPMPCKTNILIVATTDPDGAVKQIRDDYPRLFQFRDNGDKPNADYKLLLRPEPVRWIDATEKLGADGTEIQTGSNGIPTNQVLTPSAIDTYTREDAALSIMVVDATKLQGTTTAQLADYLAMIALAHPRFGADFKGSSILTLFARDGNPSSIPGLTEMDMSLLKNLYSSSNLRTAAQQRHAIKYGMRHPKAADALPAGAVAEGK